MNIKTQLLEELTVGEILDIYNTEMPIYRKYESQDKLRLIQGAFELADRFKHEKFLRDLTEQKLEEEVPDDMIKWPEDNYDREVIADYELDK